MFKEISIHIILNASYEGYCVELQRKSNITLVFLLSNCSQELNLFKTHSLNIIFDGFGIRLLGYRIECSCLYLPQGHYFVSTLWL